MKKFQIVELEILQTITQLLEDVFVKLFPHIFAASLCSQTLTIFYSSWSYNRNVRNKQESWSSRRKHPETVSIENAW